MQFPDSARLSWLRKCTDKFVCENGDIAPPFFTSAPDVTGQLHCLAALTTGK
jgi:hypothetical protein